MITPESIRKKAANLYYDFLKAWLTGQSFFPFPLRSNKLLDVGTTPASAISAITYLREQSKAVIGKGYTVEWTERISRVHGRNLFPTRIIVESEADLLWLAGKSESFTAFSSAVHKLRKQFPVLEQWVLSHFAKLTEVADRIDGLLEVLQYFRFHPKPLIFARELPLSVPTKFIEENKHVLREWLDIILPPTAINASEVHFERRYGLCYPQQHLLIRTLDVNVMSQLRLPFAELSLPVDTVAGLPISDVKVFIVENRVNALTLPLMPRSLVLGGLGYGVTLLQQAFWLANTNVVYWGDLDAEGFEALSLLRTFAPRATSLFMDASTLHDFAGIAGTGTGVRVPRSLFLSHNEMAAYRSCCASNLRIEQERIPQDAVIHHLRAAGLFTQ